MPSRSATAAGAVLAGDPPIFMSGFFACAPGACDAASKPTTTITNVVRRCPFMTVLLLIQSAGRAKGDTGAMAPAGTFLGGRTLYRLKPSEWPITRQGESYGRSKAHSDRGLCLSDDGRRRGGTFHLSREHAGRAGSTGVRRARRRGSAHLPIRHLWGRATLDRHAPHERGRREERRSDDCAQRWTEGGRLRAPSGDSRSARSQEPSDNGCVAQDERRRGTAGDRRRQQPHHATWRHVCAVPFVGGRLGHEGHWPATRRLAEP